MSYRMTTEDTWHKHWSGNKSLKYVSARFSFHDQIHLVVKQIPPGGTCIELGGFPGYFSIFFKKYCGLSPTLIDFYFDEDIFFKLIKLNGLSNSDIRCVQHDVLSHTPSERYDLVCSFGLVEHFTDLKAILDAHIKYMKPGATLLVSLPNFLGVNGLLQKIFDPENLAIHNLKVMDTVFLKNILADLDLFQVEVSYYPSTQVWIENLEQRGVFVNITIRVVNRLMSLLGKMFGKQNKMLSNSIVIKARSSKQNILLCE